jgi:hypothetical protein
VVSLQKDRDVNVDDVPVLENTAGSHQIWGSCFEQSEVGIIYSSGIPCATMLFTLVQHERGKPLYMRGDG